MGSELMEADRVAELEPGRIRYVDVGRGEPLLFVHAFMTNHNLWRKVVPDLTPHFRCIAPTWPFGSHIEPMKTDADLSPPGTADTIVELLDLLEIDKVTLVGNDTGGAIGQITAGRYPERIARLVLTPCDAFDNFPPRMFRFLKLTAASRATSWVASQSLRSRWVRRLPMTYGWVTKYPIDETAIESYVRPSLRDPGIRDDIRKVIRGLSPRYTLEAAEKLRTFEAPVLLVWSREDRFFPPDHARRLEKLIPNARLEWVEDSGSFVPEDQPETLAKHLIDFARA